MTEAEQYFIAFDSEKNLVGRYVKSIHGAAIPESAIEVDQDLFYTTIAEPFGNWQLNTDNTITKRLVLPTIEEIKFMRIAYVDHAYKKALGNGFVSSINIKLDCSKDALNALKSVYDFAVLMGDSKVAVLDIDGVERPNILVSDLKKILQEAVDCYRKVSQARQDLIANINAATASDAIAKVVWND